jgi:quercetin dioxygenase-like cupin family protein
MNRLWYLLVGMVIGSFATSGGGVVASWRPYIQDPVQQSPELYSVLLENDEVRVLEYRLKPGQKEPLHSHPEGVVYGFNDSKIRVTSVDGKVTESAGKAGDVFWRQPVMHALENIGDRDVHSLAVEIKRP